MGLHCAAIAVFEVWGKATAYEISTPSKLAWATHIYVVERIDGQK
ncbi:MAG: hypothetical protein ACRERE_40745 [Candidatus Entotheonellia bacterium]